MMEFKQLHEKLPTLIWSITDMEKIEDLIQYVDAQSLASTDFAANALIDLMLALDDTEMMPVFRTHIVTLKSNRVILQKMLDIKLNL